MQHLNKNKSYKERLRNVSNFLLIHNYKYIFILSSKHVQFMMMNQN